ncbi:hypothetical protein ccbrp13_54170 [Ktedonobacteria bacterium brp13]|nr:hypothetical protein ccbrp13_54170 [Ktedonobacteria bacterium brp13]
MKRGLLARLRTNGVTYIVAALILLLVVPLYQLLILNPTGFGQAESNAGAQRYIAYLAWISTHMSPFLIDRALLIIAFILLISFPYALYRIIVAQEIMYQQELDETEELDDEEEEEEIATDNAAMTAANEGEEIAGAEGGQLAMPEYAWRGKSFVVLAIWLSMIGLGIYLLGLIISTGYLFIIGNSTANAARENVETYLPLLSIFTNTLGTGLLGMGALFFGAMIARTGKNLWPTSWVLFGYAGLFAGAIFCISAVAVLSAPGIGQSTLTTLATLVFAAWLLWLGIMLIRLKAEA